MALREGPSARAREARLRSHVRPPSASRARVAATARRSRELRPARDGRTAAQPLALGEGELTACQLLALRGELRLSPGKRLLGLLERLEPFLDVCQAFLGSLSRGGGTPGEVGLHPQVCALAGRELPFPAVQLLGVRGKTYLRMCEGPVVTGYRPRTRSDSHARWHPRARAPVARLPRPARSARA